MQAQIIAQQAGIPALKGFENVQQEEKVNDRQAILDVKQDDILDVNPFVVSVEDDDEDLVKRLNLLVSIFLISTYIFLFLYRNTRISGRLFFSRYLSFIDTHKYIAQRVLRI